MAAPGHLPATSAKPQAPSGARNVRTWPPQGTCPPHLLHPSSNWVRTCDGAYSFKSLNIYDMVDKYDRFSCEELRKVLYLFKCDREERLMGMMSLLLDGLPF
ncbi:MAG: hypothetical protein IJT83_06545 [Victivallales bacterium]|nr:hypothetical protein [Victivallales bacterium]